MKQIIYLGGNKAMEYDGINPPPIIQDYNWYELDLNEYDKHISTLPVVDVIGDCDWKEGEVKTEGVDYTMGKHKYPSINGWINVPSVVPTHINTEKLWEQVVLKVQLDTNYLLNSEIIKDLNEQFTITRKS